MRSEAARRGLVAAALAVLAVLAVSGCPFDPRDSPEPCTPGVDPNCRTPVPLDPPLTAEIAFENIRKALRKRGSDGPNLRPNYEESLSPAFLYVPDAAANNESQQRDCPQPYFAGWVRDREMAFMEQVLETQDPDTVEVTYVRKEEADILPDPDLTRYEVDYIVTRIFAATGTAPRQVACYAASALWDFSGVQRQDFRLLRWEDLTVLSTASCPGGEIQGTLGMLRTTDGPCGTGALLEGPIHASPQGW